jgi:hypothetical protein
MKPDKLNAPQMTAHQGILATLIRKCYSRISGIFEPEVVEVTFDDAATNSGTYTYTVVSQKRVA